ncbi:hypothetical protein evm_007559 [Chilo suppressalis]|nr:hypothetical protein evm_007559 [Chilo suppressalis]
MDYNSIYSKSVLENQKNLRFWEDYLKSLQSLDFSLFSGKLTVPVMVPVGRRILFRGHLKHTNEITVAIGADYFAKCSLDQAEILRQHRIKDAQCKVNLYIKEQQYLENKISFSKQNIFDNVGEEIIEEYSEEEDRKWREKHRENMKKHKLESKDKNKVADSITDEELWTKLEELELQEELEYELDNMNATETIMNSSVNDNNSIASKVIFGTERKNNENIEKILDNKHLEQSSNNNINIEQQPAMYNKLTLLQKVIERQNELGEKLQQIKERERNTKLTEDNLISKLDEMEQLEELEDEMDRLDDMIHSEEEYIEEDSEKSSDQKIKRSVIFADEDDSETLEITFKHSEVIPFLEPYNPEKGIQKPSDVYTAFGNLFSEETTSILKKNRYECDKVLTPDNKTQESLELKDEINYPAQTILMKDVTERKDTNSKTAHDKDTRPTSLFKKKRMQNNS